MRNSIKQLMALAVLILCVISSLRVDAQIALSLELNHKSYLKYEPIIAKLRMRNYSGRAIVFGENPKLQGKIRFEIEAQGGGFIPPRGDKSPSIKGMVLPSGVTKDVEFAVTNFYQMTDIGVYRVAAIISHPLMPSEYRSNTVTCTIAKGVTIWQRRIGVPQLLDRDDSIDSRDVSLISFHDGLRKSLYLQVEDDKLVYGVVRVGREIGGRPPACEVDSLSQIHLLIPASAEVFVYNMFDANGKLLENEIYRSDSTAPILVRDPEKGNVLIAGGRKAVEGVDFKEKAASVFED